MTQKNIFQDALDYIRKDFTGLYVSPVLRVENGKVVCGDSKPATEEEYWQRFSPHWLAIKTALEGYAASVENAKLDMRC